MKALDSLKSLFGGALEGLSGKTQEYKEAYEQAGEGALVSLVNDEFTRRQHERRGFEMQWRLNLAFIEGNHYVDIHESGQDLLEIPKASWWMEREVFNHIGPIIETRIARLTRMHPVLKARPAADDKNDVKSAKTSTAILSHVHHDKGIGKKMSEAVAWSEACGTVFMKNPWNPQLGRPVFEIRAKLEGEGAEEAGGEHLGKQIGVISEGDIDPTIVPPQEFFPDSSFRQDIKDCRSIIHARAMHVDEIEEVWGKKVSPESVNIVQLHRGMYGLGGGGGSGATQTYRGAVSAMQNHALVKEYWERPTQKHPEGRLIIVAGGSLLHSGPMPFMVGDDGKPCYPFVKFECVKRAGVFWGRSVVERLIPIQRRYNALRNRKAEYLNRVAIGQFMVEEGSVDMEQIEEDLGAPGSVITYKRAFNPPVPVQTPSLPVSFETELPALLQELNQISGVSEIARQGKADPGLKSGVALSIALEQDDTRLAATASNMGEFLREAGKQWLRLYKQFAETPRVLKIVGKNNIVEVVHWSKSDVHSDDVVVEPYSALTESPAQRRQMVYEFLQAGLFNNPETGKLDKHLQAKVFEMVELGNWEKGDDFTEIHIKKAERENFMLNNGHLVEPVEYDDHVMHIFIHNNYRLSAEYEASLAENPALDGPFTQHIDTHKSLISLAESDSQMKLEGLMSSMQGAQGATPVATTDPLAPPPTSGPAVSG